MRPFVHDLWAPLNHRTDMGDGVNRPPNVPPWIPDLDARRMAGYRVQAALLDNCTRYYLPDVMWDRPTDTLLLPESAQLGAGALEIEAGKSPAEKFREYGDPRLLVEQAVALLLGDTQEVVLPDADDLPDDASHEQKAAQTRALAFADWLEGWVDDEGLQTRLIEQEEETVGLGDGVLVLGWDAELGRPRLRKYDIESYFPVLSGDQDVDEYPNKVHFAWAEEKTNGDQILHRLTYERRRLPAGEVKTYAYADKPSGWAVFQTHATWELKNVRDDGLYDISEAGASYEQTPDGREVRNIDIGVDFLPIVHVPNTPAGGRHFGRSLLLSVVQLLDDVAFADSDLAASSEVVGNTPVVVTGGSAGGSPLSRAPGAEWRMGADGDAKMLDTSNVLTGQIAYSKHLRSLLSVNTRLSEALLGRVKPNEVPSGYSLQLGFAPTRSLISKMRLVRQRKHPLILRFAMRLAQVNQALPDGPTPRAEIQLGPYLPADIAAEIEKVSKLLREHAISRRTGVQMLVTVGLPIDDAEDEVRRIQAELFDEAVKLLEATGDEQAVRDYLGMEGAPPAGVPPVDTGAAG